MTAAIFDSVHFIYMDEWHFIAERKIREAMEEGAFDHLEGMGKPLNLDENPFEDPSSRMAHRLLKNNGLAPAWVQEAREIEAESGRLRGPAEWRAGELQSRIDALNRRIRAFNLKTPSRTLQKLPFHPGR